MATPPQVVDLKVEDRDRISYHMAEFEALKAEIANLVRQSSANMNYALAVTGGVTAWLLTKCVSDSAMKAVASVPLVITLFFALLSFACYRRIGHKAEYLERLEAWLAADGLGWERVKDPEAYLGWLHALLWAALMALGLLLPLLIARFGTACSTASP